MGWHLKAAATILPMMKPAHELSTQACPKVSAGRDVTGGLCRLQALILLDPVNYANGDANTNVIPYLAR